MAQKWKFGGKEYEDGLNGSIATYDFGARNYDPALGRWMNIDPLTEQTGYIYAAMNNNPIAMNDPTGMIADWVPKVNVDGTTSYIAEAGDSAATLSEQYGIDQEQAEQITGTTGDTEISEGTEVSGEQVENVTGSDVLKLDVTSKMATDQRVFDQYKFGNEYSHKQFELGQRGEDGFYTSEFFGNIGDTHRQVWDGTATMNIGGEAVPVNFSIPLSYNDGVYFNIKKRPFFLHNSWERKNLFHGSVFGDRERGIMNYFYPVSASWGKGKENLNRMLMETRIGVPGPKKKTRIEKFIKNQFDKMKIVCKSIVLISIFFTLSCKGQSSFDSYKSCMDKSFQYTDVDFYGSLGIVEEKLLEADALKSKSKEGYIEAFQSLLSDDTVWKGYYELYKNLEKESLKGFDLKINRFVFLGTCSSINPSNEDVQCNPEYVQRYLFNQFVKKPFDDAKLLDGLFLFTDFKDDVLRKNITYLLLLNMEQKYGESEG